MFMTSLEQDCQLTEQRSFKITRGKGLNGPDTRKLMKSVPCFLGKNMSWVLLLTINTLISGFILKGKYSCISPERKELSKQWNYFLELVKIPIGLGKTWAFINNFFAQGKTGFQASKTVSYRNLTFGLAMKHIAVLLQVLQKICKIKRFNFLKKSWHFPTFLIALCTTSNSKTQAIKVFIKITC